MRERERERERESTENSAYEPVINSCHDTSDYIVGREG